MSHKFTFTNCDGAEIKFSVQQFPTECPICGGNGQPNFINAVGSTEISGIPVYVAYRCPITRCRGLYVGHYSTNNITNAVHCLRLIDVQSFQVTNEIEFPVNVREISPSSCEIYQQAHIAELNKLNHIIGPAYRKALEFLIKDFVINQQFSSDPEQQEAVRRKFLGCVINDNINEEIIKQCAARAVWLGNDETHYTRKWLDKDIQDLKALIKITTNFIDMSIEAAKYLEDMPEKKK